MPSAPPCGTSISAVMLNERPMKGGAVPGEMPEISPVKVNSFRPAVPLGLAVRNLWNVELSSGKTWCLPASCMKIFCSSASLSGRLAARSLVLRVVFVKVVELPFVTGQHIGQFDPQLGSIRRDCRRCVGVPAIMIDAAVAEHLEILGRAPGRRIRARLVERVHRAHTFDWCLLDAVHYLGGLDLRRFEDGRHDVDHMVELGADAALVLDACGPGNRHALSSASEVRGNLLGPFERSVECPSPADRHVRVGAR